MAKRGFGGSSSTPDQLEGRKSISKESVKHARRIFTYVLPFKKNFIIGLFFLALSSSTFMLFPALAGYLVDAATGKNIPYFPEGTINQIAFALFAVIVLQGIFSFFRVYFFAQVSENAIANIRKDLYAKFVVLPIPFFEQKRVGEITSRITSDVSQLQDTLSITLAELFRQVVTLIVGVIVIMVISVQLSIFMLATFPVMVLLAYFFGKRIKKLSKETQEQLGKTNVIVEETLQAINVVKAFTNEVFETARYNKSLSEVVRIALRTANLRGAFISFIIIGLFGGLILVLWYGATLLQSGDLTEGNLFQFLLYTTFIGASVAGLGDLYGKIQSSLGAAERILEILDEPVEETHQHSPIKQQVTALAGNIVYDRVAFSYPTRKDIAVLKDINFQIKAGEKIALVGPSGAGKSTIVSLLMKFYNLSSGQILIDGQDINTLNLTNLRQHIGIVPQEVLLFGGSIRENIAYGRPDATEDQIIAAAKKANAYDFILSFPEGLATLVGERGIKLSGGQRQRIAIARAILKNPAILILDEATSSLDSESESLVQSAMDELMKNRTSIIIAHRLSTIRKVDKILVIENGSIVEQGSHDDLSSNEHGLYTNLLRLQFELN